MGEKLGRWRMPHWMKPLAPLVTNTGTNEADRVKVIEEMYNGRADPVINLPLSTLQACVKSQVGLLYNMHRVGLLLQGPEGTSTPIRWHNALEGIANAVTMVLTSRAFPKALRAGMQAIADEAREALGDR